MAPSCLSIRAAAAPSSIHAGARRRPAAASVANRALLPAAAPLLLSAPALFPAAKRTAVLMRSSDSGEKNDDKLVSESGEILQGRWVLSGACSVGVLEASSGLQPAVATMDTLLPYTA
jgi:hypothetical protein